MAGNADSGNPIITIDLFGAFRVTDSAGASRMPNGSKTAAVLALLATEPRFERSRTYLQDMLWSDRGRDQRAASLRQCIAELKRALGADALVATRRTLALCRDSVRVVQSSTAGASEATTYLEGLSARDPAFAEWLTAERAMRAQVPAIATASASGATPQRSVTVICESEPVALGREREEAFRQRVLHSLSETCTVHVGTTRWMQVPPDSIVVTVRASETDAAGGTLRVIVEDMAGAAALWSGQADLPRTNDELDTSVAFCRLVSQTCNAALNASTRAGLTKRHDQDANLMAQVAVRRMFSIGCNDVDVALRLLEKAYEVEPRGVFQAWIAQALTIQYVERYIKADASLVERCAEACRLALRDDPTNSIVLAAVANARINIEKNYEAGLQLSRQSVQANGCNPLAWWAYSNALQCIGETDQAYAAAQNAKVLAEGTRLKFWCDFQVSVTAALAGRTGEAIRYGESASALAPDFRPPVRYLTALYAVEGKAEQLTRKLHTLRSLEADFTIERMINDHDYPIGMMRRYGKNFTEGLSLADV
jgi:tetratricopeptide (TPR) repeat protein